MNNGNYGDNSTLFGYSSDIKPTEIDPVQVRFEGNGGKTICFYHSDKGGSGKLIAKLNHAFPSEYFYEIPDITNYQSNADWAHRQILQQALALICGIEYVPNEDGISFAKRMDPHEQRWKRQQC